MVDPYMSVNTHLILAGERISKLGECRPALKRQHIELLKDILALTDRVDELDALAAKPEVLA